MLKAIAFDFDGVLLESVDVKTRAFQQLFKNEKQEHLDSIVRYHLANGGISRFDKFRSIYQDILQRPLPDAEFKSLCDRFARLVIDEVVAAPWVPGAQEFLEKNKGRYLFFVVSATPDSEMKDIVKRKGIDNYFAAVLGSPRKKAALLQELMERFQLKADDMLFVGDAINDWQAARQTGVSFIWRRMNQDLPMLPDYTGPWIYSLEALSESIAHLQKGHALSIPNPPLVSVLMPVYNGTAWLKESVESVLAQTYPNLELIIVNDCSTDDSGKLAESFKSDKIRVIHNKKNRGINGARNVGLEQARGAYIALLDQDDIWFPTKLEKQMALFEKASDINLVYADAYYGTGLAHMQHLSFEHAQPHTDDARDYILFKNFIPCLTLVFKRELIDKTGGFDETYTSCADFEMVVRLLRHAKVQYVSEPLGLYRTHPQSFTYSNRERQYKEVIRIILREPDAHHDGLIAYHQLRIAREAFQHKRYADTFRSLGSGLFHALKGPRELIQSLRTHWKEYRDYQKRKSQHPISTTTLTY